MRSILVQAGRDAGMTARLDTAMDIARRNEGHVTLVIDTPVDRFVTVDPYGGAYIAREALESALADDEALAEAFAGRLINDDVPFDIAQFECQPVDAMAAAARLADVAVVSREGGFAGDLAVAARCPVLVLAATTPLRLPLATACIAWDGGEQAAAALRSSINLLEGCPNIHVLTVTSEAPEGFPATDALRYLSRHGLKAELHELTKNGSVEETLAKEAARLGAQLMVMGAYGHGRVREFMFGGVTRFFLEEKTAPPLLLAH